MAGGCSLDLRVVPEMSDEMCDFSDKVILEGSDCPSKKLCVECGTSKTPLWRGGPAGPKSLCNACGIRNRKKRWALLQMSKESTKKESNNSGKKMKLIEETNINESNSNGPSSSSSNGNSTDTSSSKDKLMAMWEVLKPRNVRIEDLSEEQQAAVLLMALSHGFNYS